LRQAKAQGDLLVAVVTRDDRAEQEKGHRPVHSLAKRIQSLQSLDCVDAAVPGDSVGEWGMVRCVQPAVICVGHDQPKDHPKFLAQLEGLEPRPCVVQLQPFERERYSTSKIRQKLLDG